MKDQTTKEIIGVVAIIVAILIIIYPAILNYLVAIFLLVYGVLELISLPRG
ncbi:MAG: DUF3096 domain-containing protein [Methanothermobacter sp.]